jgi:hypothetical protein
MLRNSFKCCERIFTSSSQTHFASILPKFCICKYFTQVLLHVQSPIVNVHTERCDNKAPNSQGPWGTNVCSTSRGSGARLRQGAAPYNNLKIQSMDIYNNTDKKHLVLTTSYDHHLACQQFARVYVSISCSSVCTNCVSHTSHL